MADSNYVTEVKMLAFIDKINASGLGGGLSTAPGVGFKFVQSATNSNTVTSMSGATYTTRPDVGAGNYVIIQSAPGSTTPPTWMVNFDEYWLIAATAG